MIDATWRAAGRARRDGAHARRDRVCVTSAGRHLSAADVVRCDAPSIRWPTASSCSRSPASSRCRPRSCPSASARRWSSRASPNDPALRARFVASPHVDRLNLGPMPTTQISWDQPHEGNLFEHLYAPARAIAAERVGREPMRQPMKILSITAGAGDDVLRQLPARQRAGGRADRRAATTSRCCRSTRRR